MRFLVVFLVMVASFGANAFTQTGHYMVCSMAYKMLPSHKQKHVDALAQQGGFKSFRESCNWADDVRNSPEHKRTTMHHFVNLPRTETELKMEHCPANGCVLSAIDDMQKRLKENPNDWQALFFLAHHVGDIHQPLHVSYADDLGGNRTAVYFFGLPNNLHGVWDFAILKQAGYENDKEKRHALFNRITDAQIKEWQHDNVLAWANESLLITREVYKSYKPGALLAEDYMTKHLETIETRLQQAATRLAYLINQVFP